MTGLHVLGDSEPEQVTADVTVLHPDWESMYRDNIVGIYHLVHRRVGNAADAEDLAEEVIDAHPKDASTICLRFAPDQPRPPTQ
jgi:hypothetical protein